MQEEIKTIQFQDLDQVMRNAELRRSADLGGWLKQLLEDRQARSQNQPIEVNTGRALA
jgi:hypothetical protein